MFRRGILNYMECRSSLFKAWPWGIASSPGLWCPVSVKLRPEAEDSKSSNFRRRLPRGGRFVRRCRRRLSRPSFCFWKKNWMIRILSFEEKEVTITSDVRLLIYYWMVGRNQKLWRVNKAMKKRKKKEKKKERKKKEKKMLTCLIFRSPWEDWNLPASCELRICQLKRKEKVKLSESYFL
jgi:hypothetical protein